jgi:hypothetical protein
MVVFTYSFPTHLTIGGKPNRAQRGIVIRRALTYLSMVVITLVDTVMQAGGIKATRIKKEGQVFERSPLFLVLQRIAAYYQG